MQKITFSLKPRTRTRLDGSSALYLILRIDGNRKDIPINQYVPLKNWDSRSQSLKAGKGLSRLAAAEKMVIVESIIRKAKQIIDDAVLSGIPLTHNEFKKRLHTSNKLFELGAFMKEIIDSNPDNWVPDTLRSYRSALKLLEEQFQTIYLSDIPDFQSRLEKTMVRLGNNPNTRKKRHKQFKTMFNKARESGYNLPDYYLKPIGVIKGHRDFLHVSELNLALNAFHDGLFSHAQNKALRVFLFSCFTGCRYSDLIELTHKNISAGTLKYIAQKTRRFNKEIQVPIPEVAMDLIPNRIGKLFDVPCNQVINRRLKEVFQILEINKHISFHCSRHTFGTLYIYLGGEVTNLQQLMAHSDIDTTMNYVKMARNIDLSTKSLFDKEFANRIRSITAGKVSLLNVM